MSGTLYSLIAIELLRTHTKIYSYICDTKVSWSQWVEYFYRGVKILWKEIWLENSQEKWWSDSKPQSLFISFKCLQGVYSSRTFIFMAELFSFPWWQLWCEALWFIICILPLHKRILIFWTMKTFLMRYLNCWFLCTFWWDFTINLHVVCEKRSRIIFKKQSYKHSIWYNNIHIQRRPSHNIYQF